MECHSVYICEFFSSYEPIFVFTDYSKMSVLYNTDFVIGKPPYTSTKSDATAKANYVHILQTMKYQCFSAWNRFGKRICEIFYLFELTVGMDL